MTATSFVFAVIFGVGGGYVWSLLLRKVRTLKHGMATTPAFVFVVYGVTEWLGFSGPVAALAFGVAIGNMGLVKLPWLPPDLAPESLQPNDAEKQFFGEAVFLLKTFFFVYLGISIRLNDWRAASVALAVVAVLLLARFMAVRLAAAAADAQPAEGALLSVLIPKGLAAAVLASELVYAGLAAGATVRDIVYASILFTIILTSGLVFLQERTALGSGIARLFGPVGGEGA